MNQIEHLAIPNPTDPESLDAFITSICKTIRGFKLQTDQLRVNGGSIFEWYKSCPSTWPNLGLRKPNQQNSPWKICCCFLSTEKSLFVLVHSMLQADILLHLRREPSSPPPPIAENLLKMTQTPQGVHRVAARVLRPLHCSRPIPPLPTSNRDIKGDELGLWKAFVRSATHQTTISNAVQHFSSSLPPDV